MGDSRCCRRSVRSRRPKITDTWMTDDALWLQMSGAIAGGLVGSFAGFLANIIRARLEFRRHRHSVASAIMGELQAQSRRKQDDSAPQRQRDRMCAVIGMQLRQDVLH